MTLGWTNSQEFALLWMNDLTLEGIEFVLHMMKKADIEFYRAESFQKDFQVNSVWARDKNRSCW